MTVKGGEQPAPSYGEMSGSWIAWRTDLRPGRVDSGRSHPSTQSGIQRLVVTSIPRRDCIPIKPPGTPAA
jgi:hypothetical protein